jgi:hypothetical protein
MIYWPLTGRNYKHYNTITITILYSSLEHTTYCSQSVTRRFLVTAPTMYISLSPGSTPFFIESRTEMTGVSLSLISRPTVRRPCCRGIKHPSGADDQIFITIIQLLVCWCGVISLTRGRICRLQLLLVLASADNVGSDSRGTHDHNLLSQIRDFPFRRLLRLTGLRWRYSTQPPHGRPNFPSYNSSARTP